MRASEIFESAKDELILQRIAREAFEIFKSKLQQSPSSKQISVQLLEVPSAKGVDVDLRNGTVEFNLSSPYEPDLGGLYKHDTDTIEVFFKIKVVNNTPTVRDESFVISTLIHELRHFLDYKLSKGRAFSHDKEYLERPHEINARFSSVQDTLVQSLKASIGAGKPLSLRQFLNEFEDIAQTEDLLSIFDKNDELIISFTNFLSRSSYWRPGAAAQARASTISAANLNPGSLIGPVNNKHYRSLIRRLSTLYYYVLDQEQK